MFCLFCLEARSVCDILWDEPFLSALAFCGGKLRSVFTLRYSVFTFIAAARPAWCLFMRNSGFTYDFHSPLESSWLSSNLPWRTQNCPSALTECFLWWQHVITEVFLLTLMTPLSIGLCLNFNVAYRKPLQTQGSVLFGPQKLFFLPAFFSLWLPQLSLFLYRLLLRITHGEHHQRKQGSNGIVVKMILNSPRSSALLCFTDDTSLFSAQLFSTGCFARWRSQEYPALLLFDRLPSSKLHVPPVSRAKLEVGRFV